jgi:hypothetical protein
MTTILLTITIVSFIMTIALSALVFKLLRDERRRSSARVAALAQMADDESPADAILGATATAEPEWAIDRDDRAPTSGDLFATPEARAAWPRRLVVAAAIVAIVVFVGVAMRSGATLDRGVGSAPSAASASASTQSSGLLELLSLKHTQQANTLTISGLVQNPRDGVPLSKVAATAFLFGADGTFLASGRAPLDFTILRPGDESGFVITVPVTKPVARYRIGFRGDDGRIIGHIDRRTANSIALSLPTGIAQTISSPEPFTARGPS